MSTVHGVLCVILHGVKQLPLLSATVRDTHLLVYKLLRCMYSTLMVSGAIPAKNGFTNSLIPTNIDSINCTGGETSIFQCNAKLGGAENSACDPSADAGVICQSTLLVIVDSIS